MSRQLKNQIAFWGAVVVMLLITMCTIRDASAHGYTEVTEITEVTNININNEELSKIVAMGIASSQCHHDFSTIDWQGCAGLGRFHAQNAAGFGVAKRLGESMLLSGSIVTAFDGDAGYGAGINWRF